MNLTVDDIRSYAKQFAIDGKKWHFHILTPECQLNNSNKYALVLENTTDGKEYIVYSDKLYMRIGQELVKLLHGNDVIRAEKEKKLVPPSDAIVRVLKKAKQLMKKGVFWHHHMLFPGCKYNNHGDNWAIIFEDQSGDVIESVTENEPKSDLQHIEGLFYSQKK